MRAFKCLHIDERDGVLAYVAQLGGRTLTEFLLTELATTHAVFVNPRRDNPQRIVNELSDDGPATSIGFAKSGNSEVSSSPLEVLFPGIGCGSP